MARPYFERATYGSHTKRRNYSKGTEKSYTKLIISLKHLPYTGRLKTTYMLPMLIYRRLRGDMIEVFKNSS